MIYPVLLCGGSGTRLWPVSRQALPKQFSKLFGEESLFQTAARRVSGPGFAAPIIVTGDSFRFIVSEQLSATSLTASATLTEPESRNTAPAILAAVIWLAEREPDALMLVVPADHAMPDSEAFHEAVMAARPAAERGMIITFGIRPTRPEPGYGYLELAEGAVATASQPQPLARFIEKPDADHAAEILKTGRFLWNAGIFLFRAKTMLEAFKAHAPGMLAPVYAAVNHAAAELGFTRLAAEPWSAADAISIDHAIMERQSPLAVMPYRGAWSDLGNWDSIWQEAEADRWGNVVSPHALAINCDNTLLHSGDEGLELVGIGLSDIVAVAMPDAVMVARKSDAGRIKEAVAALKARGARQASQFNRDDRPWGWFERLASGSRFQVKRIVVKPGAALSLQSHCHRSEHWIVVEGSARATVGSRTMIVMENEYVYVPKGEKHRLMNTGETPLILIEVQSGSYLGEDDITRYEDAYARP